MTNKVLGISVNCFTKLQLGKIFKRANHNLIYSNFYIRHRILL